MRIMEDKKFYGVNKDDDDGRESSSEKEDEGVEMMESSNDYETENEDEFSAVESDDDDEDEEGDDDELNSMDSDDRDVSVCPICLDELQGQDVGFPESCDHRFCLECIIEWSRCTNTCPVDRQQFGIILASHAGEDKVFRRVAVEERHLVEDVMEEEEVEDDYLACEVCNLADREESLLLCDGCDLGYHCHCLRPPLSSVPVNEWFCPDCADTDRRDENGEHCTEVDCQTDGEDNAVRLTSSRRQIARTSVSERVRLRILSSRLRRHQQCQRLSSEEECDAGETTVAASTRQCMTHIVRSASRKRRRASGTRKGSRRRRPSKRKGKRRCRSKGKRASVRRTSALPLPTTTPCFSATSKAFCIPVSRTIKGRIAARLGLTSPPPGRCIPLQRRSALRTPAQRTVDVSAAHLSILGERDELLGFDIAGESEDVYTGVPASAGCDALILSRRPVLCRRPGRKRPLEVLYPSATHHHNFDLLGSIFQDQSLLHMDSSHMKISPDGSLKSTRAVKTQLPGALPTISCFGDVPANKEVAAEADNAPQDGENGLAVGQSSAVDGGGDAANGSHHGCVQGGQDCGFSGNNDCPRQDDGGQCCADADSGEADCDSKPLTGSRKTLGGRDRTSGDSELDESPDDGGQSEEEQAPKDGAPESSQANDIREDSSAASVSSVDPGLTNVGNYCARDGFMGTLMNDLHGDGDVASKDLDNVSGQTPDCDVQQLSVCSDTHEDHCVSDSDNSRVGAESMAGSADSNLSRADGGAAACADDERGRTDGSAVSADGKEAGAERARKRKSRWDDGQSGADCVESCDQQAPPPFSLASFMSRVKCDELDCGESVEGGGRRGESEVAYVNGAYVSVNRRKVDLSDLDRRLDYMHENRRSEIHLLKMYGLPISSRDEEASCPDRDVRRGSMGRSNGGGRGTRSSSYRGRSHRSKSRERKRGSPTRARDRGSRSRSRHRGSRSRSRHRGSRSRSRHRGSRSRSRRKGSRSRSRHRGSRSKSRDSVPRSCGRKRSRSRSQGRSQCSGSRENESSRSGLHLYKSSASDEGRGEFVADRGHSGRLVNADQQASDPNSRRFGGGTERQQYGRGADRRRFARNTDKDRVGRGRDSDRFGRNMDRDRFDHGRNSAQSDRNFARDQSGRDRDSGRSGRNMDRDSFGQYKDKDRFGCDRDKGQFSHDADLDCFGREKNRSQFLHGTDEGEETHGLEGQGHRYGSMGSDQGCEQSSFPGRDRACRGQARLRERGDHSTEPSREGYEQGQKGNQDDVMLCGGDGGGSGCFEGSQSVLQGLSPDGTADTGGGNVFRQALDGSAPNSEEAVEGRLFPISTSVKSQRTIASSAMPVGYPLPGVPQHPPFHTSSSLQPHGGDHELHGGRDSKAGNAFLTYPLPTSGQSDRLPSSWSGVRLTDEIYPQSEGARSFASAEPHSYVPGGVSSRCVGAPAASQPADAWGLPSAVSKFTGTHAPCPVPPPALVADSDKFDSIKKSLAVLIGANLPAAGTDWNAEPDAGWLPPGRTFAGDEDPSEPLGDVDVPLSGEGDFQGRVLVETRKAILPYFTSHQISKEDFREILAKSVPKIVNSGELNVKKIGHLISAYVKKLCAKHMI